ncbi:hypothetical protein B0T16DRAFT_393937 [Cercophora newfieldiana]|uniref:Uncharacterized protein n=1 Tax=Cercophora newfieldiana TaxID=92897 RepID=A0AA39XXP9_9PEZI|nr:hypothetical protein B0T16DRAFT_393937 [Cercophora newfieldiana]
MDDNVPNETTTTQPADELHLQNLTITLHRLSSTKSTNISTSPTPSPTFNSNQTPRGALLLHTLSSLPILTAFLFASAAAGAPPTYFNPRHFTLFAVLASWLLSRLLGLLITNYISPPPPAATDNCHSPARSTIQRETLSAILSTVKNIILGLAPPVLLAAQTCGVFSGCKPWEPIRLDGRRTGLELNPKETFEWNVTVLYPRLVGAFLALELGRGLRVEVRVREEELSVRGM